MSARTNLHDAGTSLRYPERVGSPTPAMRALALHQRRRRLDEARTRALRLLLCG
jgi:hypothetical protein